MKLIAAILCTLTLATATIAQSASVTLAWNPSPDLIVIGYRLYQGGSSRTYTNITTLGLVTNATVSGLINGNTYFFAVTCFDTNGLASPFSTEASYTVPLAPPVITSSPVDTTNITGVAVTFNVTATGQSLTYQWIKNGVNIIGATTPTLTLPSITWLDNGSYSVKVSNTSGSVISNPAKLAVIPVAVTGLTVGP